MSDIDRLFAELKKTNKQAFMPFITAGDPHLELTQRLLLALDKIGCDLIELGIPYSDPIADGPIIQESYGRALKAKVRLVDIFEMLTRVTPQLKAPVVMMVSYAMIHRHGLVKFISQAVDCGVAGLIVPDLPADESEALADHCFPAGLSLIQLITPTTQFERALETLKRCSGFIYYVSVAGITGERKELPPELIDNIKWLKQQTDLPVCVGFGISQPDHIRRLSAVADGYIVGSAIVRRLAEVASGKPEDEVEATVIDFCQTMLSAAKHET